MSWKTVTPRPHREFSLTRKCSAIIVWKDDRVVVVNNPRRAFLSSDRATLTIQGLNPNETVYLDLDGDDDVSAFVGDTFTVDARSDNVLAVEFMKFAKLS